MITRCTQPSAKIKARTMTTIKATIKPLHFERRAFMVSKSGTKCVYFLLLMLLFDNINYNMSITNPTFIFSNQVF